MTKWMGRLVAGTGVAALVAGVVGTSQPVQAASASANFAVTASVTANCTISAGALAFGGYDPVSTNAASPLNGSSTLTVACTKGTGATIALDNGLHASGGRRMVGGTNGDFLSYALYQDNGYSTAWDSTTTKAYNAASKTASAQTVYGRVAAGQDVSVDAYTDTVVATITF